MSPRRSGRVDASAGVSVDAERPVERPPQVSRRLLVIFATVTIALFMQSLDTTIVATALHTLEHGLGTTASLAGWTITGYAVAMVVMLPISANLGNTYGRKRVFLLSVSLFAAASLCCAVTSNIFELIVLRALQATGAAGLTPSATGIVVDHFGQARDRALGLFAAMFSAGAMTGPVLGGVIIAAASWRWIFLINVPVGVVLVIVGVRVIPPESGRSHHARPSRPDATGIVLLAGGIVSGMIGLTVLSDAKNIGWEPGAAGIIAAALMLRGLWGHVRKTTTPIVAPRLISGRGFAAMNVVNILYGGAVSGMISLVPLYAANRFHVATLASGLLLTGEATGAIVFSIIGALVLRRTGYRAPIMGGAVCAAIGAFALALHPNGISTYAWLIGATALVGVATGGTSAATRNAGLQLAPDQAGAIAAIRTMGRRVGTIALVSTATAIITEASDPGVAQAWTFAAFGALLVVTLPVITRVPEHRGAW